MSRDLSQVSNTSSPVVSQPGIRKRSIRGAASSYKPGHVTARIGFDRKELFLVGCAAAMYALYLVYLGVGLEFRFLRSDVLGYWNESFELATPYSIWWVPGYPIMIAAVRVLLFDVLPPLTVMFLVSGLFYLLAVAVAYRLCQELQVKQAMEVALLFAAYPFVGLTYSVHPIADSMATALLLLCAREFARRRWLAFTIYSALMIITHKATWFFALPLMMIAFINHKDSRLVMPLAFVPLLVLIIPGAVYYHDLFWFARWSTTHLLASRSSLPILDGLFSPFFLGATPKILKGIVVISLFIVAAVLVVPSVRLKFWLGASLSLSILLLGAFVNQYEIWAMVRFSKVLIIPITFVLSQNATRFNLSTVLTPLSFGILLLLGLASNVAFGYYMAVSFFS
jgi:hypothetical protein